MVTLIISAVVSISHIALLLYFYMFSRENITQFNFKYIRDEYYPPVSLTLEWFFDGSFAVVPFENSAVCFIGKVYTVLEYY